VPLYLFNKFILKFYAFTISGKKQNADAANAVDSDDGSFVGFMGGARRDESAPTGPHNVASGHASNNADNHVPSERVTPPATNNVSINTSPRTAEGVSTGVVGDTAPQNMSRSVSAEERKSARRAVAALGHGVAAPVAVSEVRGQERSVNSDTADMLEDTAEESEL